MLKKIIKRFWKQSLSLLLVLSIMVLSGCGMGKKEEAKKPHVTVNVWTKDKHDLNFWQEKIKEYNRTNQDNITVVYDVYSNNYTQVVSNALENGSAPDMMAFTGEIYDEYVGLRKFRDILPLMDSEMKERYQDVMVEGVSMKDGKCYFLPTGASVIRLIYNKDIFERVGIKKAPETLEEMIEDARWITHMLSEEGVYGFAVNLKEPRSGLNRSFMLEAILETGIRNGYNFSRGCYDFSKYRDLIEEWRVLLSEDCAYPGCGELLIDPLREMFSKGKIGMYFNYSFSETGVYKNQFPTEINWEAAPIPVREGVKVRSESYNLTGGYLFSSDSEHPEETWKVYRAIFADVDNLVEHYASGLSVSAVPEVIERSQEKGYQSDPNLLLGERDKLWPKTPETEEPHYIRIEGNDLFETIKELLYNEKDITYGLAGLTERYNKAYRDAMKNGVCREMKITGFDPSNPSMVFDDPEEEKE